MTGYALAEARGNTLEMLQGPKTAKQELAKLRKALQEQKEVTVLLTNYTKYVAEAIPVGFLPGLPCESVRLP